ncbi:DUF551 domain-containing protein [Paraburkholderia tropica]|uniref:DUF551 domain-containing protein n=1 Tax=Paraburkholderia tropica TaxID=92647 RepID=UPI002AB129F0|nr:DUF551 domain-containing protein [Paraburkholderia tropica]
MDANLNHWSVTVAVDGDDVLTISHNHVAGKDGLDDLAPAIRTAAAHLLCFIGAGKDIGGGNVALPSDAVQAPIYQIQIKTGAESMLWFDVAESEWNDKIDEEFEKRVVYPAPTARTVNAKPVAYRWVSYAGSFSVLTYGEQAPEFACGAQPLYAAPVAPAAAPSEWQPIETAPKTGRTLLLGYLNSAGKWRTVRGQWMSANYIEAHWEDPDDVKPGWFETSAEADDVPNCWSIEPTHWMPLPAAPQGAAQ